MTYMPLKIGLGKGTWKINFLHNVVQQFIIFVIGTCSKDPHVFLCDTAYLERSLTWCMYFRRSDPLNNFVVFKKYVDTLSTNETTRIFNFFLYPSCLVWNTGLFKVIQQIITLFDLIFFLDVLCVFHQLIESICLGIIGRLQSGSSRWNE